MTAGPQLRNESAHSGYSLRSARKFGNELRASAFGGCGPHGLFKTEIQNSGRGLRRTGTSGLADARSGPSRGEAAARCALRAQIQNSRFKITRSVHAWQIRMPGKPAAERTGLRRRGAALRQGGAAAGCRSCRTDFTGNHLNHTRRAAARRCPTASPAPAKSTVPEMIRTDKSLPNPRQASFLASYLIFFRTAADQQPQ